MEIFVSPGVYVRERDFSYYVSSVGQSSLALVGETKKGPAMIPTLITNMGEFRDIFGNLDPNKQVGYCAKSYFKYANSAYIVRVLGNDPVRPSGKSILSIHDTGGTGVLATLAMDTPANFIITSTTGVDADAVFGIKVVGSYTGNVSLTDATSPVYIETLFPRNSSGAVATMAVFANKCSGAKVQGSSTGSTTLANSSFDVTGYTNARTPLIVGDVPDGTAAGTGLFTVYSISDGLASNADIKVGIENIDTANTTFDLVVRSYSDTNASQTLLEKFPKLSMNPANRNYIARAIGDSRDETGDYALVSKYIYVDVEADAPINALPYGFNGVSGPLTAGTGYSQWSMVQSYTSSTSVKRQYLGIDYSVLDGDHVMGGWNSDWDLAGNGGASSGNVGYIKGFHLNSNANTNYYQVGPSASTAYSNTTAKFLVPLLGGRDGWSYSAMTRDLLSNAPSATEYTQWVAALDAIKSTEEYDINLLAVPGVSILSNIGSYAIEVAEDRADCFYIGDFADDYTTATQAAAALTSVGLDSNFAATYWPYVKTYDNDNEQDVTLPPTAQALESLAYTDQVAYPWFAPAGLNRGLLTDVSRAKYKLNIEDRETLYEAKINPIATFPGQGIAIWGQKTLQTRTTALDRINVRRMLLYVEKVIAGAALYLTFEQNDETTWDQFKALVQPVLDTVKIKRGLTDFRVIMDETTNTPDMIERGQMVGQIYIKPTKTAEAILINFNLMAQGAVFEE